MNIFQMSFYGGILILVIAALRPIALNRLPKKTFLALWIIAFLRLLIPFALPSAVSVYSVAEGAFNASRYTGEEFSETAVYESAASAVNPNAEAPSLSNLNQSPALPERREGFDFLSLASLAGIIGTALSAAFFITAYLKCYFEFKTSLPVKNDFADRWLKEHKLKRPLAIRQSDRIKTPMTYGVFRPVILMPKETDWENTAQLRYLLLHEYVHVCRFDSLLKLICTAAVCLHWFNPAAWLMYVLFNRDLELICDECTVKKSGLNTKAEYALALIAAEEKKAGITPFVSGFGKNSVKERIAAIMKIKKTSVLAAAAAIILTVGVSAAFATTAADIKSENTDIEEEFSDIEYEKLLALKFKDYEKMSVAEYRNKIWELTDSKEYNDLLERFFQNEGLYEIKDKNETAYFLHYILAPLMSDGGQKRTFDGYALRPCDTSGDSDEAVLEYSISLNIKDPYLLTVEEYDSARLNTVRGIDEILNDKTLSQLRDEAFMKKAVKEETEALAKLYGSDKLEISIDFSYAALSKENKTENADTGHNAEEEKRTYPNASEEAYKTLLRLMTPDFKSMSLKDFNLSLLEWANNNYEQFERITADTVYNDFHEGISLSDEELSFITLTVNLSGTENGKLVQSNYTGRPEEDPSYSLQLPFKTAETDRQTAWCDLYCEFSYHISDKESVTVGERDSCVGGMIAAIRAFWDKTDIEDLLKLTENDVVQKLDALARQYGSGEITIDVSKDRVGFECMKEEFSTFHKETATSGNAVDAALYKAYEPFGLTVASGKLYYDRQLVRCFDDRIPKDFFSVKAIGYYEKDGVIDLRAVRKNGLLTGLEVLSEEEFRAREIKDDEDWDWDDDDDWDWDWDERALMEAYAVYGIEKNGKYYYYQGEPVKIFMDQRPDSSFYSLEINPKGTASIKVIRNTKGEITGVSYMTDEEEAKILERAVEEDVSEPDTESSEDNGAGIFEPYLEYGLSFDGTQNALFYGGKRVRLFWDSLSAYTPPTAGEKPFIVTLSNFDGNGAVDLYVERDYKEKDENGYGKIIGLRIADKEEFESNSALFDELDGEIEYA